MMIIIVEDVLITHTVVRAALREDSLPRLILAYTKSIYNYVKRL